MAGPSTKVGKGAAKAVKVHKGPKDPAAQKRARAAAAAKLKKQKEKKAKEKKDGKGGTKGPRSKAAGKDGLAPEAKAKPKRKKVTRKKGSKEIEYDMSEATEQVPMLPDRVCLGNAPALTCLAATRACAQMRHLYQIGSNEFAKMQNVYIDIVGRSVTPDTALQLPHAPIQTPARCRARMCAAASMIRTERSTTRYWRTAK